MIGLPVSHVWLGYGSAVFMEFGKLTQSGRMRRDGTQRSPSGEFGVMIEWGWRLEGRSYILCGSWSDEAFWEPALERLTNTSLVDATLFGRLPELDLCFSNDMHCLSFMTEKGHPQWSIFDRRSDEVETLISHRGRVQHEPPSRPFKST